MTELTEVVCQIEDDTRINTEEPISNEQLDYDIPQEYVIRPGLEPVLSSFVLENNCENVLEVLQSQDATKEMLQNELEETQCSPSLDETTQKREQETPPDELAFENDIETPQSPVGSEGKSPNAPRSPPVFKFTSEWYYENPETDSDSSCCVIKGDTLDRRLSRDSFSAESDVDLEPVPIVSERRSSKWSATILFVASEIQMIIDLAEFCPDEDFVNAPKKGDPLGDENSNIMAEEDRLIELQPIKDKFTNGISYETYQIPPHDTVIMNEVYTGSNGDIPNDNDPNEDPPKDQKDEEAQDCNSEKDKNESPNVKDDGEIKFPVENWSKKSDYLLAAIGYSVDLANVWRFPYLAYKNGGGAFIIPYFTVLIFGAIPVFFMELSMGQFTQEGPIHVWKMVPLFKGIGYASCFMAYIVAFYYNMVIAWSFYYMFSSFTTGLPWTTCDHDYNSENCWQIEWESNETYYNKTYNSNTSVSSTFEFFERGMLGLHQSTGISDLGNVKWQLALCTMLTFTILYFCLWKSVKSAGKVVWFTATIPYLILTILLIRGAMLPGAAEGVSYFITPNMSRLGDPQVWIDAAVQIFFSIGAGFGTHIAYASYNKFNNNCYRDCLITAGVNSFTSIFSGFVVFTYLGYMATRQHKHIDTVAQEGPGLVFIVYPEAISTLPGSYAWAIMFFFMLVTLGMDSAFGGLESPLTGFRDQFYRIFRHRWTREILTMCIVISAFCCSLPCTTYGGMYVFKILDTFAAGTSLLFIVLCQVTAIAWVYGVDQFCTDIHQMTGHRPGLYWRLCWKFISPTFLMIIVISSFLHFQPLIYKGSLGTYTYPNYANMIGWTISGLSMSFVPIFAIYKIIKTPGNLRSRIAQCISPKWEQEDVQSGDIKRFQRKHWLSV
ncbi:sodium-dependent noradrenaline transporter-like [Mytilus edulis]|uniref:sodium-dependent noradrenaline transporter-like n=1 Tax=Mytilus edulis TaxID=6550 RepID=UPI0039EEDD91